MNKFVPILSWKYDITFLLTQHT